MTTAAGGHVVGEVLANKTLTSYAGRNRHGHHLWRWTCGDCGTEYGPSTISHLSRSKRCNTCAFSRENNPRWQGYEQLTGVFLQQCRYFAEKRGLRWALTPEQLWDLWLQQDGKCAYSGWLLEHGVNASLDRRDNALGYEADNVQWVHRDINRMKSDFGEDYFRRLCAAVARR